MKFLKKYGAAILVIILLIGTVSWIALDVIPEAVADQYYKRWVIDDADLLSEDIEEQLAAFNKYFDKQYGSVAGVVTIEHLDEQSIADEIVLVADECGFGKNDIVFLIARDNGLWYMDFGDVMAQHVNNDLRMIAAEHMTDNVYVSANADLLTLFAALSGWYEDSVPLSDGSNYGRQRYGGGIAVVLWIVGIAVGLILLLCLVRYLIYPLFSVSNGNGWRPLWGWPLLGPLQRKKKNT